MTDDPNLKALDRLVGEWTTEGTHPMFPGVTVHGTTDFEWLEGRRFLVCRSHVEHPDFPDALAIIGYMDQDRAHTDTSAAASGTQQLRMHYFDERGVFRINDVSVDQTAWRWWREAPGFSQRFTGMFSPGNDVIDGKSQLRRDDVHWVDDLVLTYRRRK